MKRISRGRVLLALWSLINVIMVPCAFGADRVRIGLSSFAPINAAVWIAEDKGLFKKYGIDAEVVLIGGASAGGVSSLIAGDVQSLAGVGGAVVALSLEQPADPRHGMLVVIDTIVGSLPPAISSIFGQERFGRPAKRIEFHHGPALFRRQQLVT